MAKAQNRTARFIAAHVLNRCDPRKNYAGPILDDLLGETSERQRATDLVFGTIRNRPAIDTVIATFSGRPVERIQAGLLNIVRIGTYELAYCPAAEQYAVVNEAAENAKTMAGQKQAGFVNAVLRQITRHITNRQVGLPQADATRTLVQTPSTGCEFDTDFLPDGQADPAEYLSTVFSLPKWLVADWLSEFGEDATRQICLASNRRPSVYIRPNTLKTTPQGLAEKLTKHDIHCELVEGTMIRLANPRVVTQLPGFEEVTQRRVDLVQDWQRIPGRRHCQRFFQLHVRSFFFTKRVQRASSCSAFLHQKRNLQHTFSNTPRASLIWIML